MPTKPIGENTTLIALRVRDEILAALDETAAKRRISRSALLRELTAKFIRRECGIAVRAEDISAEKNFQNPPARAELAQGKIHTVSLPVRVSFRRKIETAAKTLNLPMCELVRVAYADFLRSRKSISTLALISNTTAARKTRRKRLKN